MTADIFIGWLKELDKKFQRQNHKVVVIVDNCPAHPPVRGLRAVDLVFLPPNSTSHTQPMDQGIIKNLNTFYRNQVIVKQLHVAENRTVPA